MNPAQLLNHFDRISDAPDAIPRLRRFILDLAVRGKLVEQDSRDEPAAELLKLIQAEKGRFVSEGEGKKYESGPSIDLDEEPFPLPIHWTWARLGEVAELVRGISFSASDKSTVPGPDQLPCFRSGNIQQAIVWDNFIYVPRITLKSDAQFVRRNDILISIANSYELVGKSSIVNNVVEEATFGAFLAAIRAHLLSPQFLQVFLSSDYSANAFRIGSAQTTNIANITFGTIRRHIIALPPLAEQHRIVAKVDELMALCDRLEAAQAERESRRDRLVASSLNRLNNGADPDAFRSHARFYFNHLPRLTMHPEHIHQLRQTILNLAVRGRLSSTLDWPEKPEPLREFATLQNGYAFKSEWFVRDGIRLLRNTNVSHGVIRWDDLACLPANRCAEFKPFQLNEGDVVLSLDRPFIVTGTKVARVRPEDLPALLLQRVGRFQPKLEKLCSEYLFLWLHSPHFTCQIDPGRSNGVPHISSKQVESAEIFVPSLTEQQCIVAKVEELMALCDRLEAQLTTTQTESRRLLEAVLSEAFASSEGRLPCAS